MNNSGSITFTPLQLKLIRIGLVYLKNDFDEEDLELVGYTEEEMHKKLDFLSGRKFLEHQRDQG